MVRCLNYLVRRSAPILGAGVLLQTGGCGVDIGSAGSTLFGLILEQLVGSFVFGAFNVSPTGF